LDDVGNRLSVAGGPHPGAYTLGPADLPVNQYTATPFDARTYDLNGNLKTRNPSQTLYFDYRDRLVEFNDLALGRQHVYGYDALGRRFRRVVDDGTPAAEETRYLFDGGWSVLEERDGQGAVTAVHVHEDVIDWVVETRRDTDADGVLEAMYVHADDMGNVLSLTDAAGQVLEQYEYRDYGQVVDGQTLQPLGTSAVGNCFAFNGREIDWETGLYQYRHRYLDPLAGRFIARDPIGVWGDSANSGNATSYCGNNPWSQTDPMGLYPQCGTSQTYDPNTDSKKGDIRTSKSAGGAYKAMPLTYMRRPALGEHAPVRSPA
jgi:RHS repeat-associated protein